MQTKSLLASLALASALALGCAGKARRPAPVPTADQRIKDSRAEKIAAMPAVDKETSSEAIEQRYGIEENKERREENKRREAERKARAGVVDDKAKNPPPPQ